MKRSHLNLIALTAFVMMAAATLVHAATDERREHKDLTARSGGTLTFKAMVGAIEIKTHDTDTVTFDSLVKAGGDQASRELVDQMDYAYETTNGDVKITVKWKNDLHPRHFNSVVRHTLVIPGKYSVDVNTAGGDISAEDIAGRVVAHTSGGNIKFGRVKGDAKLNTSGGDISLADTDGNADLNTSGGNITVGNVSGDVIAHTSGGNIKTGAVSGDLKAGTSGGSIRAELTHQITHPIELKTSAGNIHLIVPEDFRANLLASTSDGEVTCELPVEGGVKSSPFRAKLNGGGHELTLETVTGKLNGGGPELKLLTSAGNIKVAKR